MTTFETFNSIKHTGLRVFNRTVMFTNIYKDFGKDKAQEYVESFNENERKQMYIMTAYFKHHGYDKTKKEALQGVEYEDDTETVIA